jgi:hypothetical protein
MYQIALSQTKKLIIFAHLARLAVVLVDTVPAVGGDNAAAGDADAHGSAVVSERDSLERLFDTGCEAG